MEKIYDIIVIGGGASGLTCALYGARMGKSVLVIEKETIGGQIAFSPRVENFPSIKQISGQSFADNLYEQAMSFDVCLELDTVEEIVKQNNLFTVKAQYDSYKGKSVVACLGAKHKKMPFERGQEAPKGVSYCALCDGEFFKGQEVSLVGDGNSALQYALLLSSYCPKVNVFTLFDKFFGDDRLVKQLRSKENIIVHHDTSLCGYIADDEGNLCAIQYNDKQKQLHTFNTPALFVAIGQVPDTQLLKGLTRLDAEGYVISDERCLTDLAGLFVAGDCRTKAVRQLTTAACDGAVAAVAACQFADQYDLVSHDKE